MNIRFSSQKFKISKNKFAKRIRGVISVEDAFGLLALRTKKYSQPKSSENLEF